MLPAALAAHLVSLALLLPGPAGRPAVYSTPRVAVARAGAPLLQAEEPDASAMYGGAVQDPAAAPAETPVDEYGRDPRLSPNVTLAADEDDVPEPGPGMSPSVRNLATVAQLDVAVQRGRESGRLAVVKFYAPWCVSCKAIKPKFERAARANDAADFYEVDFVAARPLCKAASVRYLPSAHIYGDGELQHAVPVGVRSFPKFLFKLKEAMGGEPPPPPPPPKDVVESRGLVGDDDDDLPDYSGRSVRIIK